MNTDYPMLCGIDIETTGLVPDKDYITEVGYVIKRSGEQKPYAVVSEFISIPDGVIIPEDIKDLTKITERHLDAQGRNLNEVIAALVHVCARLGVSYFVAHNGNRFDRPFLIEVIKRLYKDVPPFLVETPWIDTSCDIEFPADCRARNLTYLAAYHGFLNPFPHAAVFDANVTLKLLDQYDIQKVLRYRAMPDIVVRALVKAPFHDDAPAGEKETDKAKLRGYRWQDCGSGKIYEKCWVKMMKEGQLEKEIAEAPFKVVRLEDEK
jgi:DNA polymerase-3 subunit epsilon